MRRIELAKNAAHDPRFALALQHANLAMRGVQHVIDEDGYKIRQWNGNPHIDAVTDADVRAWLLNQRVIEDLKTGLEFIRESYIKKLIAEGYLRKDARAPFYWVTKKAADKYKLPKVMGCNFPK